MSNGWVRTDHLNWWSSAASSMVMLSKSQIDLRARLNFSYISRLAEARAEREGFGLCCGMQRKGAWTDAYSSYLAPQP